MQHRDWDGWVFQGNTEQLKAEQEEGEQVNAGQGSIIYALCNADIIMLAIIFSAAAELLLIL